MNLFPNKKPEIYLDEDGNEVEFKKVKSKRGMVGYKVVEKKPNKTASKTKKGSKP